MGNKFWGNKNVFITGATGFLGKHLWEELLNKGANITILVRDKLKGMDICEYKDVNVVYGEIEDLKLIERILGEYQIDTIFHLAAQAIVGVANINPISTFESNILGTWNILEGSRRNSLIKRVVVASSDKAYGQQERLPYDENMCLKGRYPYDVSKTCADLISQSYYYTYNLPVCVTRCGNLYGEGDFNFNRIIPQTIRSVYYKESPIIRSDGTFVRDYFYVKDAVEAYILLAENMDDKSIWGEAFNFSNEVQLTVLELVNKILKIMNSELKPVLLNKGINEIKHQYLSANKAKKLLNWNSTYSMEEGLRETVKWYVKYFNKLEK
ncbi:MAG: GDP-mannose 4,6-dehydratase [Anaeromicrobium sp.]|jgi:CDP-glucose 4,6-dehydratase|uniref:GDP-mannose 4,6-dehydratase n=1 Tax=Anaeromicrobium sp. TaxID=1929132 RepID=UPI0025FEF1DE|nr:GDP-mannose 4,6-dehydratase [Anaeromicrobium sp.]MCT4595036.1 GDP-mannose 4,6-dehydratase [Anaeromicrobium sp.]